MEYFLFEVKPVNGPNFSRSVIASSVEVARRAVTLDREDIVTEKRMGDLSKRISLALAKKKFTPRDKVSFYRGISNYLKYNTSGNVADALQMVAMGMPTPYSRGLAVTVQEMMSKEGIQTLSDALSRFPDSFDAHDLNMLKTGDETGQLREVLDILADHSSKWIALKKKIRKAISYPVLMLGATTIIGAFMVLKVIPDLLEGFITMDIDMPAPVRIMSSVTTFLQSYWYVFVGLAVFGVALGLIFKNRILANEWVQRRLIRIPVFGNLVLQSSLAQTLAAFGMFIKAGKTDIDSLPIVIDLCKNVVVREFYQSVLDEVRKGSDIGTSFMRAKQHIGVVEGMHVAAQINMAVSSGATAETLDYMVRDREATVEEYAEQLPELLNPFLMAFVVGGGTLIIVPVFMALFSVIGGIE